MCLSVDTGLILVFSQASATRLIQVACSVTLRSSTNFRYKSVKYKKITVFIAVCPADEELNAYVTLGKGLHAEPTNGVGVGKATLQIRRRFEPVAMFYSFTSGGFRSGVYIRFCGNGGLWFRSYSGSLLEERQK
ncbi:hypothetical protein EMIT0P228_100269 [Pseudomonas brassicacearum]